MRSVLEWPSPAFFVVIRTSVLYVRVCHFTTHYLRLSRHCHFTSLSLLFALSFHFTITVISLSFHFVCHFTSPYLPRSSAQVSRITLPHVLFPVISWALGVLSGSPCNIASYPFIPLDLYYVLSDTNIFFPLLPSNLWLYCCNWHQFAFIQVVFLRPFYSVVVCL